MQRLLHIPELAVAELAVEYDAAAVPPNEFALMLNICAEMGVDARRVCARTGLQPEMLFDPSTRLSYRQIEALVRNAFALTDIPHLGLLIAERMTVSTYGMVGYAMMSCATLEQAVDIGLRYYKTTSMMMEVSAERDVASVSIVARPAFHAPDLEPFMVEELFGGLIPVIRTLAGTAFQPARIEVVYPPPPYAARYRAHFQCEVAFGSNANRFTFDRGTLALRLPNADALSVKQCVQICESLLPPESAEPDVVHAIKRVILSQPGVWPDMASVSKALNMSERTLRRRIAQRGHSFQKIVDDLRREVAIRYLRKSILSTHDVAVLTGFSEVTNFRRAFKRWTGGISPTQYRAGERDRNGEHTG